jgi:hypothetical protein
VLPVEDVEDIHHHAPAPSRTVPESRNGWPKAVPLVSRRR